MAMIWMSTNTTLEDMWSHQPNAPKWKWICPVDMNVSHTGYLSDPNQEFSFTLPSTYSREYQPILLFYCDIHGTKHVMGVLPYTSARSPLKLSDLWRTTEIRVQDYVNLGASSDTWFYLPITVPTDGAISISDIRKRLGVLHSLVEMSEIEQWNALTELHITTWDLSTNEGREMDRRSYYACMYACSFMPHLWPIWEQGERALLEWRVRTLFCREHHFIKCLKQNNLLTSMKMSTDPGEGEKALWRQRWPGPLPTLFFSVPWKEVSEIASQPTYSLTNGEIVISYREFPIWAWTKMHRLAYDIQHTMINTRLPQNIVLQMQTVLDGFKPKKMQISPIATSDLDSHLPPCQAVHIWRAQQLGKHPKHTARVDIALFRLSMGQSVQETEHALVNLYLQDAEFLAKNYPSGFNIQALYKECNDSLFVKRLSDKMKVSATGAYGCDKLIERGACPMKPLNRDLVKWMGVDDIEDKGYPQQRCCAVYAAKRERVIIRHPCQYAKLSIKYEEKK
jgi:hypothetical protein